MSGKLKLRGKLRLAATCLLLACLAAAVVSLADGRANQRTAKPAEGVSAEGVSAEEVSAAEVAVAEPAAEQNSLAETTALQGSFLQGPIRVSPNPAYLNRPVTDEEVEPPVEPPAEPPADADEPDVASDKTAEDETTEDDGEEETVEPAEPLRELSPEMAALRDRVRGTLAAYHQQTFSTQKNTATDVMNLCLAFGCNSEIYRADVRQKVNGITCLCWNYRCAGYEPLAVCGDHIAAKIGYGLQTHPSQLLAVLALSRVPADYPVRVGEDVRTVADLVEAEKLTCRSGNDMSLKLIGLAWYVGDDDATWENELGETWSVERIVKEEVASEINGATAGGTLRLLGLGYAVNRRISQGKPIEGQFERAQRFISQYTDFALELQNADGSWGPNFLATRGTSRDQTALLRSSGHILGWLAVSVPEEQLADPRMVKAVAYVNRVLAARQYRANLKNGGQRHIDAVMHALHGLAEYDRRWFKPADPPAQPTPTPNPTELTEK